MELTSPKNIREEYIKLISEDSEYNNVLKKLITKKNDEPIYTIKELNYEEPPDYNSEQRELLEVSLDLNSLNNGIVEIKDKISSLITYIDNNVDNISSVISKENERISDMNTICMENSEYNMVTQVYASDFSIGDTDFENIKNKYFGAKLLNQNEIDYEIVNINGNGISGNNFILKNDKFENEEESFDNYNYINDNNDITKYEYSRYITNDKSEVVDNIINYDNKNVSMTITLHSSETNFNKIEWLSENKDLIVKDLATSDDGIVFTSRLENPISTNEAEIVYNDSTYIYGSDILCFPYCSYVRITFESSENLTDTIAIKDDEDNIIVYPHTKRKKIAINNIKLYSSEYSEAILHTDNLILGGSVDKAALFCSEYIPNHFIDKNYIEYYLIVNGEEYEVVPVNSGKNGIRLIKFEEVSSNTNITNYIKTISETIKSIHVKIVIKSANKNETPYIGNIKLCLAKESGSIYV